MKTDTPTSSSSKALWQRLLPLGFIAVALTLFFVFDGPSYISLDWLRTHRSALAEFVDTNFVLTLIGFMALYIILVAISFPGAGFLSIFGGFLFGGVIGSMANIVAATIGATLIFLAARYAVGEALSKKAGPYMKKFEAGLKENEFSYIFILRLIPVVPFFIVNIVPALFNVKIRNYMVATFFGIIPGAIVYTTIGDGVSAIFEAGGDVNLAGVMLQPRVLMPIIGLVLLSLLPVIYKKLKTKKTLTA